MEVGMRQETPREHGINTRFYAPTRGSAAYAYAQPAIAPQPQQQPSPMPKQKTRQEQRVNPPPLTLGGKLLLVISILMLATTALLVIAGYAEIAEEYAQVNQLKADIEQSNLRLAELNVALECQVGIQEAKAAAVRLGMTYPTAEQYVQVGDPLPGTQAQTQPTQDNGGGSTGDTVEPGE